MTSFNGIKIFGFEYFLGNIDFDLKERVITEANIGIS